MNKNNESVCAWCHSVVGDDGYPIRVLTPEEYAEVLSHGICRECSNALKGGTKC
jgi:hypothetical protein